jgi:hypothetical protein
MANIQRIGDLDIGQDIVFQRREWSAQRIGWALMALLSLAALAGLLGPGPLSRAIAGDEGGSLWLEYSRFERLQDPTSLKLNIGPLRSADGTARVWVSRDYLQKVQVEQVTPPPESVEAGPDRLTYVFRVAPADQPTAIVFHINHQTVGKLTSQIGLESGPELSFGQFVYP